MNDEPKFKINFTLVYQLVAIGSIALTGIVEFVRMSDRINSLDMEVKEINEKAARIPTVETRLDKLEIDTLKRSGPIVDKIHHLEEYVTAIKATEVLRVREFDTIDQRFREIQNTFSEHTKTDELIRNELYQLELRRPGGPRPPQ